MRHLESKADICWFMKKILSLLIATLLLQGCAPLLLGGAATAGVGVAHDRRSTGTLIDDNTLEVKVKGTIASNKLLADNSNVSVTGYNGMVLLTGEAFDDNIRQQITAMAKSVPGVKRVENQLVSSPQYFYGARLRFQTDRESQNCAAGYQAARL